MLTLADYVIAHVTNHVIAHMINHATSYLSTHVEYPSFSRPLVVD